MSIHSTVRAEKGGSRKLRILIPIIVLLVLAAVFFTLRHFYVFADGLYRRDSASLDLRGKNISEKKYVSLCEELPECTITWDVPLSGGSYDCESENLTLASFTDEDTARLAYFTRLTSLDLTAADVTAAQFDAVHAAYPAVAVRWSIPIGAARYASDAESITLSDFETSELSLFDYFTALRSADGRACTCYDALLTLREAYPELELTWQVPLRGTEYLQDAAEIAVDNASVTPEELAESLRYLPNVQSVSFPACTWTEEQKDAVSAQFPNVSFVWPVELFGTTYESNITELDLTGRTLTGSDLAELSEKLSSLGCLERVDLTDTGVTLDGMLPFCKAYPAVDFVFSFDFMGVAVSTQDTVLDLTGIEMESTESVEALLPVMHHLEKVDMSDCGFSDEEMDALNKRYEDIRFVWTMHISYYDVRTDATGFRATEKHYGYLDEEGLARFKYCEDMVAIDIGHRRIPTVEFLYDMPQVKYLVLQRGECYDITPIGSLEDLVYLELHRAYVNSLSPLLNCKKLQDLNLVNLMGSVTNEELFDFLMAMDSLEMVWLDSTQLTDDQLAQLREAHPDCLYHEVPDWDHSVEDPWRYSENYYAMRDALGMAYMNGEGSWVDYKVIDGEKVYLDPEFVASQSHLITDTTRG
jgi:uncharacterized protein YjbI with pentapeptide repeats